MAPFARFLPLVCLAGFLIPAIARAQEARQFAEIEVTDHSDFSTEAIGLAENYDSGGPAPVCPPADCNCPSCQAKKAADLKKAVAGAYAPLFYNNNFAYLNNPNYDDYHFGENLKQIPIGDRWMLDLGGQYRARFHAERNHRNIGPTLGLTGNDDD